MNTFSRRPSSAPFTCALLLGSSLLTVTTLWHGQQQSHAAEPSHAKVTMVAAPRKLAFVASNVSDFWTIVRRGAAQAEHDLKGVEVQFREPANGTLEEQSIIAKTLLVQGVKGIAIVPCDPDNEVPFLNQVATKANLVTADVDAPQSKRACYIGTDNYAAGVIAGNEMKRVCPLRGQVALFVGIRTASSASERERGIRDALKSSRLKIVEVFTDDADRLRAKSNAATALVKYPMLVGMMGLWSYNGPQIRSAVQAANKQGKVKIVCFDEEEDTLDGVRKGVISATIVQNPYELGYQSIKVLDQLSRGDRSGIPTSHQILIPTRSIRRDNVDTFWKQLKKLQGYE